MPDVPLLKRKKKNVAETSKVYSGAQLLVDDSFGSAFVFEK